VGDYGVAEFVALFDVAVDIDTACGTIGLVFDFRAVIIELADFVAVMEDAANLNFLAIV
jgi:hypothetical protein